MSLADQAIKEFGESMGMKSLGLNDGITALELENSQQFFIQKIGDDILLYLIAKIDYPSVAFFERTLTLCHFKKKKTKGTLYPGLIENDKVLLAMRLREEKISTQGLDTSLDFLIKTMQTLEK